MIEFIHYSQKLSPEEHYCLYMYYLLRSGAPLQYQEHSYQVFDITERLIDQYNHAPALEKQRIDMQICSDPRYPGFLEDFRECPWKFEKPVLWSDREKTGYFIQQLKESHAFEVYIEHLFLQHGVDIGLYYGKEQQYLKGETSAGIEIKYDKLSIQTGNYYIEYQERMRSTGHWVKSGILKPDDTRFYLLGTIDRFAIFERNWLLGYYHRLVENRERLPDAMLVSEKEHGTSKGFILRPAASSRGNIPVEKLIQEYL